MVFDTTILLTIFLGIFAGIFGGALGQSGAETLMPGLLILGIVPNFKVAAGTVLLTILPPLSLLAIYQYYKRGQVKVLTGVTLFICYFFLAYVGARMTNKISNKNLQYATGVYYLIICMFFFWNAHTGTYGQT